MATFLELAKIKHHAVRSDGAKFLDGERDDALDTSWLSVSNGQVTLSQGVYDELLVVKDEVSDDQIKAWASMGAPFYDPTPVIPDSQIPSAGEWSSKNKTFYQTDPPVGAVVGDLWVDTDDNDRLYRWDGATWVDITDKSPVDAEKKPVYVKGAGADIDIDKYGIRATRKTDGKKTFEIDAETGNAYFGGHLSAERIIEGIEVYGGLTADLIKAGAISYDRLNVEYARVTNVRWIFYHASPTGPHDLQVELISSAASQDSYNVFKATYTNVDEFTVIVEHNPLKTVSGIGNIQLSSDGSRWFESGFSVGWNHTSGTLVGGFTGHFENLKNTTTRLFFQSFGEYRTGQLWVRFQRHAIS